MSESEVQAAILKWLGMQQGAGRLIYWRVSLGAVKHGGVLKKNPMRGHPDLAGIKDGRYFAIEVKADDGRFNLDQLAWCRKLEKAGAFYIVATDLECVKEALK